MDYLLPTHDTVHFTTVSPDVESHGPQGRSQGRSPGRSPGRTQGGRGDTEYLLRQLSSVTTTTLANPLHSVGCRSTTIERNVNPLSLHVWCSCQSLFRYRIVYANPQIRTREKGKHVTKTTKKRWRRHTVAPTRPIPIGTCRSASGCPCHESAASSWQSAAPTGPASPG